MNQTSRLLLTVLGLLVVAGAVGLYAWKGVYEPDVKEAKVKETNEKLFSAGKADEKNHDGGTVSVEFSRVAITYQGETSVLERESGGEWKMTAPVQAAVDKFAVDGVVSALQQQKFKYVADESPDDAALEKYGLKAPQFVVESDALVGEAKEKRSVKLVGGAENTFNGSIFVRRNDEKQVWAAEGGVKWTFGKTSFDLRNKDVFTLDEPKVQAVEVKTKANAYSLERDAKKDWAVKTARESFRGDSATITTALTALRNDKAIGFPRQPPPMDGADELTFKAESGESVQVKLLKVGEKAYEQVGSTVAEVNVTALGHFDKSPNDLRDKTIAIFNKDQVAKLTFHLPEAGPDIVIEKDSGMDAGAGETWKVIAPKQGPAKQFKMAALLWTLGSIKYAKAAEAKAKPVFEKGKWIAVWGADGKELARLSIGADVPGAAGQKFMKGTTGQVVEADASRLSDLPTKLEDVLDVPAPDGG
jgi:hypothetical protein